MTAVRDILRPEGVPCIAFDLAKEAELKGYANTIFKICFPAPSSCWIEAKLQTGSRSGPARYTIHSTMAQGDEREDLERLIGKTLLKLFPLNIYDKKPYAGSICFSQGYVLENPFSAHETIEHLTNAIALIGADHPLIAFARKNFFTQ